MAISQLTIYNNALILCGERALANLSEVLEPRYLLDQAWDNGAGIKACLEQGQWFFAMRTVQVDYDTNIEPGFGYHRAFEKPSDWVLTSALCSDEFFRVPLLRYVDEAGYWYSDIDTIYVRYVSNHASYGLNYASWPESFREYVEEYFCNRIIRKVTGSQEEKMASDQRLKRKLAHAKSRAAMTAATAFPPRGGWSQARNVSSSRRDGGSGGSLIG